MEGDAVGLGYHRRSTDDLGVVDWGVDRLQEVRPLHDEQAVMFLAAGVDFATGTEDELARHAHSSWVKPGCRVANDWPVPCARGAGVANHPTTTAIAIAAATCLADGMLNLTVIPS